MDPSNSNSCEIAGALFHKRRQRAHFTVVSALKQSIPDHEGNLVTSWLVHAQAELQHTEKLNTEDTEYPRAPQRNRGSIFRRLVVWLLRPSVLFVAFLLVLCVKFRKAQIKVCPPCKHFDD